MNQRTMASSPFLSYFFFVFFLFLAHIPHFIAHSHLSVTGQILQELTQFTEDKHISHKTGYKSSFFVCS